MRTVYLYGSLAQQFGPSFRLAVRSLAEAANALGCQLPGFRRAIEEGQFRVTCGEGLRRGLRLDASLVSFGLPAGDLHVLPVVRGAKNGGIGKIIVGTLIAAATWWVGGAPWLISIGASVALSGASQLLSPKKKAEKPKRSFMFDEVETANVEGNCVPLVIGRVMAYPPIISAGVTTSDSNGIV